MSVGCSVPTQSVATSKSELPQETNDIAIDVLHYNAEIAIEPLTREIRGVTTIQFRILGDGDAVEFNSEGLMVDEVRDEDRQATFLTSERQLKIRLARHGLPGELRTIRVRYRARPSRGLALTNRSVYTMFQTDSWMPCRFAPSDKATLTLTLLTPHNWKSVATGVLRSKETTSHGNRSVFDLTRPYSAYLFGFAAGLFQETTVQAKKRPELRFLGYNHSEQELHQIFAATERAMTFFESVSGVAYPGERYTQVLVPKTRGQELAGLSLFSETYGKQVLADEREDWLVVHELAHQWWGNLVTCARWNDFWMHEALATFMTAVYKEDRWGKPAYERELELAHRRYAKLRADGRDRSLAPAGDPGADEVGGAILYAKGILVLDRLRSHLGDQAFFRGIQRFTKEHAGGTATSQMFKEALEHESQQDLTAFFANYIYGNMLISPGKND